MMSHGKRYEEKAGRRSVMMGAGAMLIGLFVSACGHGSAPIVTEDIHSAENDASNLEGRKILAGDWEYEENGVVVPLVLDAHGNGDYDFKGGKFITRSLSDHSWSGQWVQAENDREGEFEVRLSPDYSAGEGRWWYTRIERDTSPARSGGRFRLVRVQALPQHEASSLRP